MRKRANRVLLLRSYRDGEGKVRQARLGHFLSVQEARDSLRSQDWRDDFSRRNVGLKIDWDGLADQAEQLPDADVKPVPQRPLGLRVEEALSTFLRLWPQLEDARRKREIADLLREQLRRMEAPESELETLQWQAEAALEPRRTQRQDGSADFYLKTLGERASQLQEQGRMDEACGLLERRVTANPSEQNLAEYGAVLQMLGRTEEAIAQYRRIPRANPIRHYNLASLYCTKGRMDEALTAVMDGLLRDSRIARATTALREGRPPDHGQEYWEKFGHLWDPIGRWFLMGTYAQPLVKLRLSNAAGSRVLPRMLVKGKPRALLLQRVLYWDPPQPKTQVVARRKRSKTASQEGS
ncbi:MAG: hypothetical protein J0I12_09160 [Candidatus Eremiobacteraeota bacterium]|nr:hypothetical protein [Candidatus Eremiobacteraeota bacterium]